MMGSQVRGFGLAMLVASSPLAQALSSSDIPSDTPTSKIIASAAAALARGQAQDALVYYDVAVSRDPQNYMTFFRRGAAYLQLGKYPQASQDFDRVLTIRPTFEGALIQRAKINSRNGRWQAAVTDYQAVAGKTEEIKEIEEAQGAEKLSEDAEKARDWSACTTHADMAIQIAAGALHLRQRRANCRFEKGEIIEGLSDLLHVAQISASEEAFLRLGATYFYALDESDNGLGQMRKCMHSDPDSKPCRKLLKAAKAIDKRRKKIKALIEKRQFNTAVKQLVKTGDEEGLLDEVKAEYELHKSDKHIPATAPSSLYNTLIEQTCEAYTEMNALKKAQPYCDEALTHNPNCLPALVGKATREIDADQFEEALRTLNTAAEAHPQSQKVNELRQKAQTLLKRSKQKDYYKVLGLTRDADEREIKRAYRRLSKEHHPDKASKKGVTIEEAQKKMASINEAYEVLSDPELKQRFDMGDDPNDTSQQQANPFQGSPFGGGQPMFFQHGGGGQQFQFRTGGNFKFGGF